MKMGKRAGDSISDSFRSLEDKEALNQRVFPQEYYFSCPVYSEEANKYWKFDPIWKYDRNEPVPENLRSDFLKSFNQLFSSLLIEDNGCRYKSSADFDQDLISDWNNTFGELTAANAYHPLKNNKIEFLCSIYTSSETIEVDGKYGYDGYIYRLDYNGILDPLRKPKFIFDEEAEASLLSDEPLYDEFIKSIPFLIKDERLLRYDIAEYYADLLYHDPSTDFDNGMVIRYAFDKNSLGYQLLDIDKDGIDELFIMDTNPTNMGTMIYSLYTISNDELIHVFASGERDRYYLSADNNFIWQGSGSAFDSFTANYSYNQGKLKLESSLIYNTRYNENNPWIISYTDAWNPASGVNVTKEEADSILSETKGIQIEINPLK